MKKVSFIVLVLILAATAGFASAFASGAPKTKAWTYLVYMAADNNLDTWGDFNLDLMSVQATNS